MAVVFCLPAGFSPLFPSPSSSFSSLSSSSYCGAPNCRIRNDVSRRRCMCDVSSAMMFASSSASSFAGPELGPSVLCSAASFSPSQSFLSQAATAIAATGAGGAIHHNKGRLLSSSSTILHRKKGWNGFESLEASKIRIIDQRGEKRWKGSPAKDTGRDVLTDPAEDVSRQRLTITRNGEEQEEDENGSQGGELAEEEDSPLERDSFSASSASEAEVRPAATKKDDGGFSNTAAIGTVAASLGLVVILGGFGAVGYLYKDQLNVFLIQFSDILEGYGPAGYGLFVLVYAGLELLAIPAIPLTMSAGLLFGASIGTIIVSIAGTIAATGAFLIARYLARDRLLAFAKGNKKFMAIDKAIGDDGFRVVTLLRLSPLLPFSLGNYLYGLTSVKLGPYVLGSWLGMLPGSWAYVSAGAISRSFIIQSENEAIFSGPEQWWTLGLGLAATVFAATYVTRIAKEALKDIDE